MAGRWRRAAAASTAVIATAGQLTLTACSENAVDQIDYAVDGALVTYNTTTVAGAASAGPQAFARTLTGFGYHGPSGQVIADHDFGTVSMVGGAPLVLEYQIADDAVYSDDAPITCDDMVLAWAAQSGLFPQFRAANQAGYTDIAGVDCRPGEKKARVSFAQDRAFDDYKQLFTATSMMPSHVIADELGLETGAVTAGLLNSDLPVVGRVAEAWNTIWQLTPELDTKRFPSSGPYKIDTVLDSGAVVLVANDRWWGAKPVTKQVTVWPQDVDIQDRVNKRTVDVVDVATGSAGALIIPDDYRRADAPAGGVEQLIFAPQGPLTEAPTRRALALCTPRDTIARDAMAPIVNTRLYTATDDALGQAENAAEAEPFMHADPDAARKELDGEPVTVRIGYREPNARLAAIVGAIAEACAPAGITVAGATSPTTGPQTLTEGEIDALLASTGGATGSGSTGSSAIDAYELHAGNGNNLSRYNNGQIDGIIAALAVTVDPTAVMRLLGESAPVLWAELPTLPLYRQQRTLLTSKKMSAVGTNPTRWGAGWNMDRWVLGQ